MSAPLRNGRRLPSGDYMESLADILKRVVARTQPLEAVEEPPAPNCPICQDLRYVGRDCRRDSPSFGKAFPCRCTWEQKGLATFQGFNPYNSSLQEAKQAALEWASETGPGLLVLAGNNGVGKTHLAQASLLVLVQQDQDVLFQTEASIFTRLHAAMRPDSPFGVDDVLHDLMVTRWLILDDVGATVLGQWDRSQLDAVIDARWQGAKRGQRTLVTTNLTGQELSQRVASRLRDVTLGRIILMQGRDYRQEPIEEDRHGS